MKKLAWIGLLLLLCLSALWLLQQPDSRTQKLPVWPSLSVDKIVTIIIDQGRDENIILQLVDGQWLLSNGDDAAEDAVFRLLDDLVAMQPIRVVTRKHDHDEALGMVKGKVQLQCLDKNGQTLLNITIGKQGSDLLSTYVRLQGHNAVVAVNRTLIWQVKRSKSAWKAVEKKTL